MKIEMNTIYNLPTLAHENDFLRQAEEQGLGWPWGQNATEVRKWRNEVYCIRTGDSNLAGHDSKRYYEGKFNCPTIIEWKIRFSKADMQIGQIFKDRYGSVYVWSEPEIERYQNDLCHNHYPIYDIVEIYPMEITPIWKRQEPKYRVKIDLTREQAEKLGLEFCEEVKG